MLIFIARGEIDVFAVRVAVLILQHHILLRACHVRYLLRSVLVSLGKFAVNVAACSKNQLATFTASAFFGAAAPLLTGGGLFDFSNAAFAASRFALSISNA